MARQAMTHQTDGELIRRTLSGESQAFGRLVEKYQGLIYGLAYNRIGNTADAQDIAQDVFVRAFRKLSQLEDPDCFSAWIKSITANECKTWLRNLRPTVSLDESEYSPAHDSAAQSIWRYDEFRTEVAQAIQALSERNREVITLYYLSGMTCEEIAKSLETTPSAVQSRLHRARQLLKAEFTGEIEGTLGEHRLPDGFSRDVLRRATVHPVAHGFLSGDFDDGEGAGAVFLGIPQEQDGAIKLIAVSMRSADARGIVCPPAGDLGATSPECIRAQLAEYRADGIEPIEFALYLDERGQCVAQAVLRRGRARIRETMKASRAIALAFRAPAPIFVAESIAELREVGEDGFRRELRHDLDTSLFHCRVFTRLAALDDRMFQIGMEVEKGFSTALISRDIERRVVHASIEGLAGATFSVEFGDDPVWVDYLWEMAGRGDRTEDIQPDGRRYWVSWEPDGDDVRMSFCLHDRDGNPVPS